VADEGGGGGGDDHDIWWTKHQPTHPSELATNPKKVAEVFRMLVLVGSAGSGKTATVHALANEMGIEIIEWVNPTNVHYDDDDRDTIGLSKKFRDFFDRALRYSSLDLAAVPQGSRPPRSEAAEVSTAALSTNKRRLILLEDIPSLVNDAARQSFYSTLTAFLNSPTKPPCPLVFILTECYTYSQLTYDFTLDKGRRNARRAVHATTQDVAGLQTGEQGEQTLYSVLPASVLDSPCCHQIKFRPVAQTFITKCLRAIVAKELGDSRLLTRPNKHLTEQLKPIAASSQGDIRAAISALQWRFLSANRGRGGYSTELEAKTMTTTTQQVGGNRKRRKIPAPTLTLDP
ncbi:RFC checkpoint protein Rad17, partial [Spiromyces aspiralis]